MADGGKTLSKWLQALSIWRLNQKSEGSSMRLPKKGSAEYKEIMIIMEALKSGEYEADPHLIKTISKPRIPKPKSVTKPKLVIAPRHTGDVSQRGKDTKRQRDVASAKKAERELIEVEKELKQYRKDYDAEVNKVQDEIIKLLVKLEGGDPISDAELKIVNNKLSDMRLSIADKAKRMQEQESFAIRKRKAEEDATALRNATAVAAAKARETAEAKRKATLADIAAVTQREADELARRGRSALGLTRDLTHEERKDVEWLIKNSNERSRGPPTGRVDIAITGTRIDRLRDLDKAGYISVHGDRETAEYFEKKAGIKNVFWIDKEKKDGLWRDLDGDLYKPVSKGMGSKLVEVDPDSLVSSTSSSSSSSSSSSPTLIDLAIDTSKVSPDAPLIDLGIAAPITSSLTTTSGTADPESVADAALITVEDTKPVAKDDITLAEAKGMQLPQDPRLLPGGRDSGPINLGSNYTGPCIKAGMLYPGSRNTGHNPVKNGNGIGGSYINIGTDQSNYTATQLVKEFQEELVRLRELKRQGIAVLSQKPGQSIH